jgi:hypothetical protein
MYYLVLPIYFGIWVVASSTFWIDLLLVFSLLLYQVDICCLVISSVIVSCGIDLAYNALVDLRQLVIGWFASQLPLAHSTIVGVLDCIMRELRSICLSGALWFAKEFPNGYSFRVGTNGVSVLCTVRISPEVDSPLGLSMGASTRVLIGD